MTTQISDQKHPSREAQNMQALFKDAASFEHIYRHYQPVLQSYLARSTGNRELAEDLTQETFIKAWQVWSTVQEPKQIKAWLYCVAKHFSIAEHRRYTRKGRMAVRSLQELQEDLKDETALSNQEQCYGTQELVRATLARMSPQARQILLLALHDGNSYQEISQLLDLTIPAVRMRLYHARQRFQMVYRELDQPGTSPVGKNERQGVH